MGDDFDAVNEGTELGALVGGRKNLVWWLVAGAAMLGVVIVGIVTFTLLDSGESASTPTPGQTVAYVTPKPTVTPTLTPTPTATPTPTPEVILLGVKALGELDTVEYSLETVVDKEAQQSSVVTIAGIEIWKPRLHFLLIASGRVKAGVDFREMTRYEVVDYKVTVYLPSPRITDYYVDTRDIELYYIRTDFGLDEQFAIEKYNEAVVEAQESLRRAALESGILDAARANAVALVQSLILGLGFSEVEVKFLPPGGDETLPLESPQELILTPAPFPTATIEG
jgi:hypothetical protein